MAERKVKKPWVKFKLRIELYENDPICDWDEYNFLGYILKKYKDKENKEYEFSYSCAPCSCEEIKYVKKMISKLSISDNNVIIEYINFVYDISNSFNFSNFIDYISKFKQNNNIQEKKITRIRKINGLDSNGNTTIHWSKFKQRLEFYNNDPVVEWNEYNFLGYILKRYKEYIGFDFSLSHKGTPSKCKEIYCIKKMLLLLGTTDGNVVRDYIDFVFDTYIIPKKIILSSLAYFLVVDFSFEFKKYILKRNKITRTTTLPSIFKKIICDMNLDVGTYGDLAFAKLAIDNDPNNTDLQIYLRMFDGLREAGFDDSVLERLDGN